MIVVRIHGGLGNQMFQYALGRNLSIATGQRLRLETGMHNPSHLGKFALDKFNIVADVAPPWECRLWWRPVARLVPRIAERMRIPRSLLRIYHERQATVLDPEVLGITGSAYLVGNWQNQGYFEGSAETIRNDFTLRHAPTVPNGRLLVEIERTSSVAVHVRRGDFVRNPRTATEYNVCDLGYYHRACERIAAAVRVPKYFVFSDEPAWCREHLGFMCSLTVVDNNPPEEPWEDLRLMAACKHFVIANSSLSWWAAWLGGHSGKTVVAPARWCTSNWLDVRRWLPGLWQVV